MAGSNESACRHTLTTLATLQCSAAQTLPARQLGRPGENCVAGSVRLVRWSLLTPYSLLPAPHPCSLLPTTYSPSRLPARQCSYPSPSRGGRMVPAISGNQRQSATISDHQRPSATISYHQRPSAAIRSNQQQSAAISSNQQQTAAASHEHILRP